MNTSLLLKKLYIEEREFITDKELKEYCISLNLNYTNIINYFLSRNYLLRIFRGIFYIKTLEELRFNKKKYSYLELIAKGLELKGIKNWYFSLYTALKLNNATHEYFSIDYVTSENLYRSKPINIDNRTFRFIKLSPKLLEFGILKNGINYSDLEKTILDFVYLWIYNGKSKERILMDLSEYKKNASKSKINEYASNYPNSVKKIIGELL